jgi:phosphoglycerate dehydrogenase-like enzyme
MVSSAWMQHPDPLSLRVLVTDPIICRFETELRAAGPGHDWAIASGWSQEDLLAAIVDADVLVCSRMSTEMAAAASRLKLVQVTGAGYDKIPLDALAPSVQVANAYRHGQSIAEYVIMATLMLSRRQNEVSREMSSGIWHTVGNDQTLPFPLSLRGKTMGVIGMGGIGAEVAAMARGMGMRVQAVRRNPRATLPDGVELDWIGGMDELPQLLGTSDVVVIAVPLTAETLGFIDAAAFASMQSTAIIINVARGPIIDEEALYDALRTGVIAGAGIDVWWSEPGTATSPPSRFPFHTLDNVTATPHNAGHARVTFERRAEDIASNIDSLAAGRPLINVVRYQKT